MLGIARFAMRGPGQAVGLTLIAGVLTLLLPPVVYLSAAVVSLVSLQLGLRNGMIVAAGASAALAVVTLAAMTTPAPGLAMGLVVWAPAALLAERVRSGGSLRAGVQWLTGAGAALAGLFHVALSDPVAWWRDSLAAYLATPEVQRMLGPEAPAPERIAELLAPVMPGLTGVALVSTLGLSLLLGRFWQAALYRPGAFGGEFRALRFGRGWAAAFAILLAAGLAGLAVAGNLATVLVVLFMLQGLAIVHKLAALFSVNWLWLGVLYAVLVIALPQMALVLALLGAADNWLDFRQRAARAGG